MHYLLDLSVADIAHETGTSVNTVKSWLSRGRHSLAAVLGASKESHHAHDYDISGRGGTPCCSPTPHRFAAPAPGVRRATGS